MPFRSEKQRRYLYAREPRVARRWAKKYGNKIRKHGRQVGTRKRYT